LLVLIDAGYEVPWFYASGSIKHFSRCSFRRLSQHQALKSFRVGSSTWVSYQKAKNSASISSPAWCRETGPLASMISWRDMDNSVFSTGCRLLFIGSDNGVAFIAYHHNKESFYGRIACTCSIRNGSRTMFLACSGMTMTLVRCCIWWFYRRHYSSLLRVNVLSNLRC